ncbi:MAG: branched-chain amino acid ABC transporter permease [Actinomycetia bacterium]|nr:branched-chain amino acid ABC transporter permease [Actinomycetes bacterium]
MSAVYSILSGISYGMVLFLLSAGVSIVFGLMNIINLAHGMLFMLAGYAGIEIMKTTGSFWLALVVGILAAGVAGLVIERGFLRTLYAKQLSQILVCFGFIYIITNLHLWFYGPIPKAMPIPEVLTNSVPVGPYNFSYYRIMIIAVGFLLCGFLYWVQERTRVGAIVRAGMEKPEMVNAMGINLMAVNIAAFFVASCLSGLAGVLGTGVIGGISYFTGGNYVFLAIAVCIIGGVGSIQGALAGALIIGVFESLAKTFYPPLALYIMYLLMALVIMFRPSGLLGRK